jgi:hypothetical protein
MALTILAGGPEGERNPDTSTLVSTMTRALPPHRLDFGRDVVGGEPADISGGAASCLTKRRKRVRAALRSWDSMIRTAP